MSESKAKVEFSNGFVIKNMELRDYFAVRAMQSLAAAHIDMFIDETHDDWYEDMMSHLARDAYFLADKMLKEREK